MSRESLTKLSELTGFAPDTVKSRLSDLIPIKGPRNAKLYESKDALPLIYNRESSVYNLEIERARLLFHQANNEALKEKVNTGELIPADEVKIEIGKAFSNVRSHLLTLPTQLAARCVNSTQAEVKAEAKRLINHALAELACKHYDEEAE